MALQHPGGHEMRGADEPGIIGMVNDGGKFDLDAFSLQQHHCAGNGQFARCAFPRKPPPMTTRSVFFQLFCCRNRSRTLASSPANSSTAPMISAAASLSSPRRRASTRFLDRSWSGPGPAGRRRPCARVCARRRASPGRQIVGSVAKEAVAVTQLQIIIVDRHRRQIAGAMNERTPFVFRSRFAHATSRVTPGLGLAE